MRQITIRAFAKINLSIDVHAPREDGYHAVDMIMQQLCFCDDVQVQSEERRDPGWEIRLDPGLADLPADRGNLAYRAAEIMADRFGRDRGGVICIRVIKRIPVAAGLAGGSGNGAAVVHALNALWDLNLSLSAICAICAELGSDVPFSACGQAFGNPELPAYLREDPLAVPCARATGRGTELAPVRGIDRFVVIAKPELAVSTAEVYRGIDRCAVTERPDNDMLTGQLAQGFDGDYSQFINVLEQYTLSAYPEVAVLKEKMSALGGELTLMSGSGPTVFTIYGKEEAAERACASLRKEGYTAHWTRTLIL